MVENPCCLLTSDLHGDPGKWSALFSELRRDPPGIVLLAGDLLPAPGRDLNALGMAAPDFINGYLVPAFAALRRDLGERYPRVLLIPGNDDPRFDEATLIAAAGSSHLWTYLHDHRVSIGDYTFYGYACIPPSPFLNKDWERYDVSRYVDPGCVSPEEGRLTVPRSARDRRYGTIAGDLQRLSGTDDLSRAVFLFHAPPYDTILDTADLAGKTVDHVPLDPHIGSVAIRRFIEARSPWCTLHGHVHESFRLTGRYSQRIGETWCISAAAEGTELAIVRFDLADPGGAGRISVDTRLPRDRAAPRDR